MSQLRNAFFGALIFGAPAVSLLLGAMQLASGRDLAGAAPIAADRPATTVNRTAKADLVAGVKPAGAPMRTISLRHNDLADMSVLIRVPVARETREIKPSPPPLPARTQTRWPMIACEPVVSVLTEIAKRLQPGRCLS